MSHSTPSLRRKITDLRLEITIETGLLPFTSSALQAGLLATSPTHTNRDTGQIKVKDLTKHIAYSEPALLKNFFQ